MKTQPAANRPVSLNVLPVCNWQGLLMPERSRKFRERSKRSPLDCRLQTGSTLKDAS